MKLRLQKSLVDAGRPIVFLPDEAARLLDVRANDRVEIKANRKRIISIVDTVRGRLRSGEISLSEEIISYLDVQPGEMIEVKLALNPRSTISIAKKLHGKRLGREEIYEIIRDIVNNALTEAEIAYFVSAVYTHGMTLQETIWLTEAIYRTGKVLSWKGMRHVADKHSIGGIAGNRTTPIVVAICAAAGVVMPKTSSRAITSAAGTADVIETIARVDFSAQDLQTIVTKAGACLAWGGALGLAPADDKLIRVERLLNVDPESQLIASILAKKLAVGSKHVLIDIPYGLQAKVTKREAEQLRQSFMNVARAFKLNLKMVLTVGDQPIGNGIGPVLEMRDVLHVLRREDCPLDLETKALMLAGDILEMVGICAHAQGQKQARVILESKRALAKFEEIISLQGRKKTSLALPSHQRTMTASKSGKVIEINNKMINRLCRMLGCPADKSAGIYLYKHNGDIVRKGEAVLTLYAESKPKLNEVLDYYHKNDPVIVM